jgi:hypothetical protein
MASTTSRRRWTLPLLGTVLAMLLAACGGADPVATGEDVQALFEDPQQFVGQEVQVQGTVGEQVGDVGFQLENPDGSGQPVLVITSGEDRATISEESVLDVVGTVRELDPEQVSEQLGEEIDTAQLEQFAGQAAIIAEDLSAAATDG